LKLGITDVDLFDFERQIAEAFNNGQIRAPIHLAGGNEKQLIDIFRHIEPVDWVCCQWRSHYHCLLKGVPREELKAAIMEGRSIALTFPKYKVICSAIAGGIVPIAMGIAWQIKRQLPDLKKAPTVWCFIGDMTAKMGVVIETARYAACEGLPLEIVVEKNGLSVSTPIDSVWTESEEDYDFDTSIFSHHSYFYSLPWPHSGAGKRIEF